MARHGWRRLRKLKTPKPGTGLGELKVHITAGGAEAALAYNLCDHFLPGLLIGEEKELTVHNTGREPDHRSLFKDQHGLCLFAEEFAFRARRAGASTGSDHGGLERHRLIRSVPLRAQNAHSAKT